MAAKTKNAPVSAHEERSEASSAQYLAVNLAHIHERLSGISVNLKEVPLDVQDHGLDAETVASIADGAAASISACVLQLISVERDAERLVKSYYAALNQLHAV